MVARASPPLRWLAVRCWDGVAWDLLGAHGTWCVHSVFERAFNLVSPDGALLGVVRPPAGNGPATLVLAPGVDWPPLADVVRPGDPVTMAGECLIVGGRLALD